nr:Stp1/IreP family PP2C-type Ser/Thr phosphatase [Ruminococcus sp. FC2018]
MNCLFLSYKTDIGMKRSENQDRVYAEFLDDNASISVVCDGMGGASSGGVASQLAIDSFISRIKENFRKDMSENSIRNMMLTSVHFANTVVYENSKADIEKNGMGTTIVSALVVDKKVYIVSVGDSRAYIMNKDGIKQITTDHTYVEMLYRNGQITAEEKETHELRNVITRAIGVEADVDVDYFELEEYGNFTVFLCSDGLSKYCDSELIYNTVFEKNLDQAAAKLIGYSNDSGGKDNITVAIVAN